MNSADLCKNIRGCLIGVAAGDAMGMPTSMMSPETIRKVYPKYITSFLPAPIGHKLHSGMQAGQVTDDTQQTLILADSIIACKGVDPEDIARRLIQWGETNNAFNSMLVGPSTLRALYAIRAGKAVTETGSVGDTNGAPMRIAPVGIYGKGDLDRTLKAVELACLPTHNTNIAIAGSAAIAMAIGCAINGEKNVDLVIEAALEAAEKGMLYGNIWYGASIIKRTRVALEIVNQHFTRETRMRELYDVIGAGVQVSETVPLCLAVVKLANGDPVEAVQITANLGGDCDTTGAIAGSICGAIAGSDAFPADWIRTLENVNRISFNDYTEKLLGVLNEV